MISWPGFRYIEDSKDPLPVHDQVICVCKVIYMHDSHITFIIMQRQLYITTKRSSFSIKLKMIELELNV